MWTSLNTATTAATSQKKISLIQRIRRSNPVSRSPIDFFLSDYGWFVSGPIGNVFEKAPPIHYFDPLRSDNHKLT
jgi:hypothetical protein